MIKHLFDNRKPFAVCIGTIEAGGEDSLDWYYIIPKTNGREFGYKVKGYRSVMDLECSKKDVDFFRQNKSRFKLTLKSEHGFIYEPDYIDFREHIKLRQCCLWD